MNRGEIKRRIAEGCGDNPDTPVFFTDAQLNTLVDEAVEVLAEEVRAIHRTTFIPLKEGAGFIYTPVISPDFMTPIRVWNQTLGQRITCLSMTELDAIHETWQTVTANPEIWFPVSWDMFGIYPRPAEAGGVLRIDYLAWPRALLDDSDRPELPEATQDAAVLYGQYMATLKKWDADIAKLNLVAFQKHEQVAKARTGINRIAVRSFQRPMNPQAITTPNAYQGS